MAFYTAADPKVLTPEGKLFLFFLYLFIPERARPLAGFTFSFPVNRNEVSNAIPQAYQPRFSCAAAGRVWPVASALDSADLDHGRRPRKFYWTARI